MHTDDVLFLLSIPKQDQEISTHKFTKQNVTVYLITQLIRKQCKKNLR